MWPGQQQPGGGQNPQPNPYQQPGYPQQPNPYQQPPGYQQQPNPYAQPGGPQPGGQWNAPGMPPQPPQPPRPGRNRRTTLIAASAALAVVAAAVVTGVVVLKGGKNDDKGPENNNVAKGTATSAPATPSPAGSSAAPPAPEDNPRAGVDVKPVIPGWKTVVSTKRQNAFDVPPDWKVNPAGTSTGFELDGKPIAVMTSTASYKSGECSKNDERGKAGSKGAQGAKSEADAAETEALNWVWAAFDKKKTGTFDHTKAQPYTSDHGISGYWASAKVTGVQKTDKCSTDGKSFTVTYKTASGDLATWVLYAGTGFDGELPDDTIKKIMSTLRPYTPSTT
ncbi:hypothetical protein GCM10010218_09250 [Streptomyces mashuensis]|uniref:DUF8017 domain-containing protein n=1 Tax=Streptomyces mashuensis TaxID=33904 RepID=A0A919AWR0_9ACTN|nr:hypothetical protein [Streptomyces mashuensis]GHF30142.1 hypothetical protein GCM10010218_09250 [Streptomyces mashuensis]